MLYQFDFRAYRRPFKRPLSTSHGTWDIREGIILRITNETGQVGWGEIAPIPWFGSETFEEALTFCQQLPSKITAAEIFSISAELPACQFGFESAWEWGMGNGEGRHGDAGTRGGGEENTLAGEYSDTRNSVLSASPHLLLCAFSSQSPISFSYLLPAGEAALHSWQPAWNQGSRTFKWKIGVAAIADELNVFNQLIQVLPPSAKLRLDANGGLTQQETHQWLKAADEAGIVEFLEQPLPPGQFDAMLEIRTRYSTPIALDESVATLSQLKECYQRGWRGIFVIKAAIAGSPKRLRQLCQDYNIDAVFSSVFESAIARQAALQLAAELSNPNRAVGFGVNHWFNDDDETWLEHLWKTH
jgi:O-succinylbenzoate synthase